MLKSVAEDFNSFMFEEGKGIDLKLKQPALQKEIVESAGELADDDTITAETAETLALLNITHEAQVADAEEDVDEPEAEPDEEELEDDVEVDDETGEEVEPDEEVDEVDPEDPAIVKGLIADVKKSKKLDDIKAIAKARGIRIPPPFLKDLAKLKPYVIGKLDGSSVPVVKPEKKKSEKKVRDGGVGGLVRGILTASKESWLTDDGDILAEVKKKYPDANTNMQNIMWYRYEAKKKGLIPVK